jgi:hypothetical protein
MIQELQNIIKNNNTIIDAINNKKDINIEKAIRACLLSNNRIAELLIKLEYDSTYVEKNYSKNNNNDFMDMFNDILKGKKY